MRPELLAFIKKLQNSPHHVKRNWLIGLSSGSGLLVVALWLGYLNLIVKPTAPVAVIEKPGVAATFGKGVEIVFGEAKKGSEKLTGSVKEALGTTNEISIQKPEEDFILDGLEPVKKTTIP